MRCPCGKENPDGATHCAECGRPLREENRLGRLLIDIAALLGLLLALAVVFALDRGEKPSEAGTPPVESEQSKPEPDGTRHDRPLRLAVTPREYDDMGKLLDTLGSGYHWDPIDYEDLLKPWVLSQYDVVFFTCGDFPRRWRGRGIAPGQQLGSDPQGLRPQVAERLRESLRSFVAGGGTLYASDWRFKALALAFANEGVIDREAAIRGDDQTVQAEVLDPGLQRSLGKTIDLKFDKPSWDPAAFRGPDVETLLRGKYKTIGGDVRAAPLLVKFPYKNGTVIFTSFHNEAQNNKTEMELLRFLVFASVMAREEASVRRTMVQGGFSPMEGSLLAASAGDQSVTQTYRATEPGDLQFALAFQDRGARLRLTVTGPDGQTLEKTGTSTLSIDVSDAPAGDWRYTITPLEVPYRNFPFSLNIGKKQKK
jgi:hypothetical protein